VLLNADAVPAVGLAQVACASRHRRDKGVVMPIKIAQRQRTFQAAAVNPNVRAALCLMRGTKPASRR
jgi:hypothetical protein